jgi:predicted permease
MRNLRYAVRVLLKAPVFTLTTVATLALCIGANTAIYTVVDRVLLRPLPYPHPERLALVVRSYQGIAEQDTSQAGVTWVALRQGAPHLDVAAFSNLGRGVNLVVNGQPEYVSQGRVSAGYFRILGVAPALGREFTDGEDRVNGPAAVVLSHALWTRVFHADRGVVGRGITLRGEPHTVVGVMPAPFVDSAPADVWTPLRPSVRGEGGGENYGIIARLRDGASWPEANTEVASATASVVRERYERGRFPVSMGVVPLQRGLTADTRQPLLVLWSAVGAVLLIGCFNVAGLLLARGRVRSIEIATRMALGGGRPAIVRQLLAESFVLAASGGGAGIALGYAGSKASASLLADAFGVTGEIALDARVLVITLSIALSTSVLFGLLPALELSRVNLRDALTQAGSPSIAGAARGWPRRAMVFSQVALGVVLVIGAGLLIRTFEHLMRLRPGFDAANVMTATLSLQDARYQTSDLVVRLFDDTIARMHEIAGVEHAAVALALPYERALNNGFRFVGGSQPSQLLNMTYVTPEYFETVRIPTVRGRGFTGSDTQNAAPVIVVNQAFVRRHSPDQDPIGRQLTSGGTVRTIVGVVGDVQQKASFGNFGPIAATPAAYIPAAQTSSAFLAQVHTWFSPSWIVRLAAPQEGIVGQMAKAVQSVDPQLPFAKFRTLADVRGQAVGTPRAQAVLLGIFAALALLLAAVGIYGLVANSIAERTRELGIRMALGATSGQAVAAAAVPGAALVLAGIAAGLVAARFGMRAMAHLVWGVSVGDPLTFGTAAATVLVVAIVATIVPALRAARLNPTRALQS